jgi:hypothetical protein
MQLIYSLEFALFFVCLYLLDVLLLIPVGIVRRCVRLVPGIPLEYWHARLIRSMGGRVVRTAPDRAISGVQC